MILLSRVSRSSSVKHRLQRVRPYPDNPSPSDAVCRERSSAPSNNTPSAFASLLLTFTKRSFAPSASFAKFALILSITGMTAILSLRGKIAVRIIVALGAFI